MVFKRNENCNLACKIASVNLKCVVVGIGGTDIQAGHKQYTLAIVWQLRRMYLLSYLQKVGARHGKEYTDQTVLEEANDRVRSIGKNSMITSYSDPSLKTSRFLLDLISSIEPRAVDDSLFLAGYSDEDLKQNARFAIAAARKIGAPIFCLWEDIVEVKPKMILTFIGSVIAEGHKVTEE